VSDRGLLAVAAVVAAGARLAWPVRPIVLVAVLGSAVVALGVPPLAGLPGWPAVRRVAAAAVALALALWVGARAHDQLAALDRAEPGPVSGVVTVRSDPERGDHGSVSADVALGDLRYRLDVAGAAGATLAAATVGGTLRVEGRVRPFGSRTGWHESRHLAARMRADSVEWLSGPGPLWAPANRLRDVLARGASSLDPTARALFEGVVLGDDRRQRDLTRFTFQASGLSHLLVVSGSNVAVVLTAARPITARLPFRARWVLVAVVLLAFGSVVRWEPSVCRAIAMAAAATLADQLGRRSAALRTLLVAVLVLVCLDPLMVRSVGFQLSVAATAGLALGARRIAERLPGPRPFAEALGVVLAAQVGCLPLLLAHFGLVPAAGLLVNLVAVPLAGWLMVWGLTAGFVAGLAPPAVAAVLHCPTALLATVLDRLAEWGASPVLPRWDAVAAAAVVGASVVALRRGGRPAPRAALAASLVLVACAWSVRPPPVGQTPLGRGAHLEVGPGGSTTVRVGGQARFRDVAEGLERARVRRLDLVVLTSAGPVARGTATDLARLWPPGKVVVEAPVG